MSRLPLQRDVRRNLTPEDRRKERQAYSISVALLIVVLILTYTLPDDVLTRYPGLYRAIQAAGAVIPSIQRFGRLSTFPQVAQVVYALEVIAVPFLATLYIRSFKFDVSGMSSARLRAVVAIPFSLVLVLGMLTYIPGNPDGLAWSARISRSLVGSRLGFVFWSVVLTGSMAASVAVFIGWAKTFPIVFGSRR